MYFDKQELRKFTKRLVTEIFKEIRKLTSTVSDQNNMLDDWRHSLVSDSHKPQSTVSKEQLALWKVAAYSQISEFIALHSINIPVEKVTDKDADPDPDLESDIMSDLLDEVVSSVNHHANMITARRRIISMKKILKVGAAIGLFYAAYVLLKDGEKAESAIERAKDKIAEKIAQKESK